MARIGEISTSVNQKITQVGMTTELFNRVRENFLSYMKVKEDLWALLHYEGVDAEYSLLESRSLLENHSIVNII
jgi:hypothetical protein